MSVSPDGVKRPEPRQRRTAGAGKKNRKKLMINQICLKNKNCCMITGKLLNGELIKNRRKRMR